MTITEQGKSPRRCRIIQTGSMPDGSRVYLVSAVDDGHRITVVQAPRKPDGSVAPTKFYHWTTEGKPPAAIASLVVQEEGVSDTMASAEVVKPVSAPARLNAGFEALAPAPIPVAAPESAPLPVVEPRSVAMRVPAPEPIPTPAPIPSVVAMGSSKAVEGKAAEGSNGKNGKGAVEGTKGGKAAEAGTKGSDGGKAAKAADPGVKGGRAAEAGTKGSDGGKAAKAADPGVKGGKAAEAADAGVKGSKAAKAADPGVKGGKAAEAADAGVKGSKAAKAADPGVKGGKAVEAGTKGFDDGKAADAGTKGGKGAVDPTSLPLSKASAGDPLKTPLDYQKSVKGQKEAGETLMEKLRRTLGMGNNSSDGSENNGFGGSRRGRRVGTRSMEAAGVTGDYAGFGEGFPIMLGTAPVNPPSFRDLPKPPYAPNLPGPETNPYVASPDRGVSPGMANAFTSTSSTRPIPADFGAQPIKGNAFTQPPMPGPAPVAQVNLPVPGMNPLPPHMMPGQMGMPHQATPIQTLPGGASAGGRGLGLVKKSKVDDDGASNAFTSAPAVATQPMMLPAQQPQLAAIAPQATVVTTTSGTSGVNPLEQPVRQLRESLLPSEREVAIETLASSDLRGSKEATSALLTAAFRDPAITVRLSAIRTLAAKLGGNPQIIGALRALKEDGDARIRAEAESALNQSGSDLPTPPSMPKAIAPRTFPGGN